VRDAASQFEALLIASFLKSARESSTGWMTDGEDQAGATATDLAEKQLAQSLARQGGLGLARMVISGLETKPSGSDPPLRLASSSR
jgi:Rod binding domain-containing protein